MKLIGSKTSPFVRRIRLFLAEAPYEFEILDVLSEPGRSQVFAKNPVGRIPVLIDGQTVIWDSRLILRYLLEKTRRPLPSLETELKLDLIDNANDTGVALFQIKKFNLDPHWQNTFSKNQVDRLNKILNHLEHGKKPELETFEGIWLFCLLDWIEFREVSKISGHFPKLEVFWTESKRHKLAIATDPRS